ncbi:MAG: hypothetical protein M1828_004405 [Chrysothrix sp. TS-e1954]|nr:MAG: hypothetical protein M1828_004405 [Chrysothrix sp. TS-e1954]
MDEDMDTIPHEYVLGRNTVSSARLNLQHYLWTEEDGYLLHPSIGWHPEEGGDVADIGTGTGIWLIHLAKQAPKATLDGFDISISQTPPKVWLPSNVKMQVLDIFTEIPKPLRERYDVVNIRLFMCVVSNNDPGPIIRNLVQLMKPGGWLQWGEFDLPSRKPVTAEPGTSTKALEEASAFPFRGSKDTRMTPRWVPELGKLLTENGMEVIISECRKWRDSTLVFNHDSTMMVWEEMRSNMDAANAKRYGEILSDAERARNEAGGGIAMNVDRWTFVARKPLQ